LRGSEHHGIVGVLLEERPGLKSRFRDGWHQPSDDAFLFIIGLVSRDAATLPLWPGGGGACSGRKPKDYRAVFSEADLNARPPVQTGGFFVYGVTSA
jgi:hypothetical protein